MDPLTAAMRIAGSGLNAQSNRLRVVSENIANAQSTSKVSGGDHYQRKTISFAAELDRAAGLNLIKADQVGLDYSSFPIEFDPGHSAADDSGYVKMPNVNVLVEMADMREANRSYEANLQVVKQVRDLVSMTIELMRPS
ncbi:MAG: flagellar basal body rod protein FlgC [Rhizobiaceae bacterium]|nr:flagellar basal body rod protein FlgC [Rhizobiaceae bacterium]